MASPVFPGVLCAGSTLFLLLALSNLTVTNTLSEVAGAKAVQWPQLQAIATEQFVRAAGASLIASYIIVEGVEMVISAVLRDRNRRKDQEEAREQGLKRGREQGLKQGREQGREQGLKLGEQQANSRWREWNQRRLDAEARGEAFLEPPPDTSNNGSPPSGDDGTEKDSR